MLTALISTRILKQAPFTKLRGDVLIIKSDGAVFSTLEHARFLIVEWEDNLLEANNPDADTLLVHPYAEYDPPVLDEPAEMRSRSRWYVDVDAMPNADDILDEDVVVQKMSWAAIAPYVKERM